MVLPVFHGGVVDSTVGAAAKGWGLCKHLVVPENQSNPKSNSVSLDHTRHCIQTWNKQIKNTPQVTTNMFVSSTQFFSRTRLRRVFGCTVWRSARRTEKKHALWIVSLFFRLFSFGSCCRCRCCRRLSMNETCRRIGTIKNTLNTLHTLHTLNTLNTLNTLHTLNTLNTLNTLKQWFDRIGNCIQK